MTLRMQNEDTENIVNTDESIQQLVLYIEDLTETTVAWNLSPKRSKTVESVVKYIVEERFHCTVCHLETIPLTEMQYKESKDSKNLLDWVEEKVRRKLIKFSELNGNSFKVSAMV